MIIPIQNDSTQEEPVRHGGVRCVGRAFSLLEAIADNNGMMGLSKLAVRSGLPLPTVHRTLQSLVDLGYVRHEHGRQYLLGPRLMFLGERASTRLGLWAKPYLEELAVSLGEPVGLALLDGDQVVYIAQAQSQRSMQMFTEVGLRLEPHCTAVGKAVMAEMPVVDVLEVLGRTGMPRRTKDTITDKDAFMEALARGRENGYSMDDGEQEVGVRCVAVPVLDAPARLSISVFGPATRMTNEAVARFVPRLQAAGEALSRDLQ